MLERFELLQNLNPYLLQEVENSCISRTYKAGEFLITEGDLETDIYFLIAGSVNLYKIEPKTQQNLKFKEQVEGDSFGEMSFIDNSPRSCSVEAASDVEVYVLSKKKLLDRANNGEKIISILAQTIAYQVNDRLRYLSDRYIISLQEQIQSLKDQNFFGMLFISIAIAAGISALADGIVDDLVPNYRTAYLIFVNWIFLGLMIVTAIFILAVAKIPLKQLGVTKKNIKKSIIDGLVFSAIGIIVILATVGAIDIFYPEQQLLAKFTSISISPISLIYLIHTIAQEFIARGITQTSIQKFLSDRGLFSILITSFIFGIIHAPYGLLVVGVTFIASLFFGAIYLRTQNLAGVTIVHYVLGVFVFEALFV